MVSTHSASFIERLRCQVLDFDAHTFREEHALRGPGLVSNRELLELPLFDQHTVRVGRRPQGSLDTSDDGLWRVLS